MHKQNDLLEKQEQIRGMNSIYCVATKVVAYLGEEADRGNLIPPFAKLLVGVLQRLKGSLQIEAKDLTRFGLPSATPYAGRRSAIYSIELGFHESG